jgi:hypothetical protein
LLVKNTSKGEEIDALLVKSTNKEEELLVKNTNNGDSTSKGEKNTNEGDEKKSEPTIEASPRVPIKNAKAKTSLNLNGIFKSPDPISEKAEEIKEAVANQTVIMEKLLEVWSEYAEQRKNQAAEYQLLKREFQYEHPVIFVVLTNPVEETLIENFRRDFIAFLRDRLKNSELTITTRLQEVAGKKVIYTSKEKFEHLAEKNPYLNELKERLGLDWDF